MKPRELLRLSSEEWGEDAPTCARRYRLADVRYFCMRQAVEKEDGNKLVASLVRKTRSYC